MMNVIKKMYKDCLLCELFLLDIYLSSSAKSAKTADSSRFDMNSEYKVHVALPALTIGCNHI